LKFNIQKSNIERESFINLSKNVEMWHTKVWLKCLIYLAF
jgi:hypothetical protein